MGYLPQSLPWLQGAESIAKQPVQTQTERFPLSYNHFLLAGYLVLISVMGTLILIALASSIKNSLYSCANAGFPLSQLIGFQYSEFSYLFSWSSSTKANLSLWHVCCCCEGSNHRMMSWPQDITSGQKSPGAFNYNGIPTSEWALGQGCEKWLHPTR